MTTGNDNYGNPHGGQGNWQGQQPPSAPSGQPAGYGAPGQYGNAPYDQGYGAPGPYGQPPQQGGSNKTGIIIAAVVVILLVAGALLYFFVFAGDDDDDSNDGDQTTTEQTTDTDDTDTDDPFTDGTDETEDPLTDGTDETEDPLTDGTYGGDDQQYGDPNADPAAFRQGMEDILEQTGLTQETAEAQGISEDQWNMYLECVTDESLQRLSPEAIESISAGNDVYDSHSVDTLSDIATQCGTEAGTL
ncbi:MAG: hypothetical protein ACTHUY_10155 [Flaviflexus sp.]|uniref:hypothetical protein n=1 Tax=Flaviflexus sp. TaxID=1969482 RepID=UPI003F91C6E2